MSGLSVGFQVGARDNSGRTRAYTRDHGSQPDIDTAALILKVGSVFSDKAA